MNYSGNTYRLKPEYRFFPVDVRPTNHYSEEWANTFAYSESNPQMANRRQTMGIEAVNQALWYTGFVPYQFEQNFPTDLKNRVLNVFDTWNNLYGEYVRLIPKRKQDTDFVKVVRSNKSVCQTQEGRIGGEQKLILSNACSAQVIEHVIEHLVGSSKFRTPGESNRDFLNWNYQSPISPMVIFQNGSITHPMKRPEARALCRSIGYNLPTKDEFNELRHKVAASFKNETKDFCFWTSDNETTESGNWMISYLLTDTIKERFVPSNSQCIPICF